MDLELHTVLETPQELRDLREATTQSIVGRLKTFALECKHLSARSIQTYETLAENPKLQTLEAQLQEAKKHADTLQAHIKTLTPVERMKRFAEQLTTQQKVHTLQSKVMEVSQLFVEL
jgi:cell division protein FtsL